MDNLGPFSDIYITSIKDKVNQTEMSSTDNQVWLLTRHNLIFEEIMLMIGHSSLESLDSCRQVCRTWNDKIMDKIWERPTKRWGSIIQRRIERSWGGYRDFPSNEKISKAKLLGKQTQNQNDNYRYIFNFSN